MRNSGIRSECITMGPHDHIGWVFSDLDGFAAIAVPFLAAGAALGQRLMYIGAEPTPAVTSRLASLCPEGVQTAGVPEVYGPTGAFDPPGLLAFFAAIFVDALNAGYTGLRVAADTTPMVTGNADMSIWYQWEMIVDRFIAENPASALCAFNGDEVDVNRLRHLASVHPLSSASGPVPRFRLFAEQGCLRAEGTIDSFAVSQIPLALDALPPGTPVLIDLARSRLTSSAIGDLRGLRAAGITVTTAGDPRGVLAPGS
jgi:hypothetical protein